MNNSNNSNNMNNTISANNTSNANNTNNQLNTVIPPEAYAARVRMLIEWALLFEEEGNNSKEKEFEKLAKRAVQTARKNIVLNNPNCANYPLAFPKEDSEFYGYSFEDYVQDAYKAYMEESSNADEFAAFLEKKYQEDLKRYHKKLEKLQEEIIEELETKSSKLSDQEFDDLLTQKYAYFLQCVEKRNAYFSGYLSLFQFLKRQAQNNMSSKIYAHNRKGMQQSFSINDEEKSVFLDKFLSTPDQDTILRGKYMQEVLKQNLSEFDYKIVELLIYGKAKGKIAEDLGCSKSTITQHLKKIKDEIKRIQSE